MKYHDRVLALLDEREIKADSIHDHTKSNRNHIKKINGLYIGLIIGAAPLTRNKCRLIFFIRNFCCACGVSRRRDSGQPQFYLGRL